MLRCRKARRLIASYLYEELDERERARVEAHLDGCPRCAEEVASRRETLRLIDSVQEQIEYPDHFEERFPAMVRGRIELGDTRPSFARPLWAPSPLRQAAMSFCVLLLGVLIGSSAMVFGGLRSAHYNRLVRDARQMDAVVAAVESGNVLDQLGTLKLQLAAEGKTSSFAKLSAIENVLLDLLALSGEDSEALYLARTGDREVVAGNFADASRAYETLLETHPESVLASNARQMVAFIAKEKLADYPQAVRQYEVELAKAEQRETEDRTERALFDFAETCFEMGEYDNATAAYWSLVERFPSGAHAPDAVLKLGDLYFDKLRDFGAAREMYHRLAASYGDTIDEMGVRPRVETRLVMLDQSARYGFKPISLYLAANRQSGGRAFGRYEKVIHMYPNTILAELALDEMAAIEWYGPEYTPDLSADELSDEQRIEALRRGIARCSWKDAAAFAHMAIGDVFRDQIKDVQLARREYQLVLDSYPESLRASEAQSRLNGLVLAAATGESSQS